MTNLDTISIVALDMPTCQIDLIDVPRRFLPLSGAVTDNVLVIEHRFVEREILEQVSPKLRETLSIVRRALDLINDLKET